MQDFEGPLDLILYLLGKNKMEIQDISISLICDQYMAWLARRQEMDLEVASEFVTMASQLVYIKTRMLLSIEDEEAQSEMDALIALSGGAEAQRELRQGEVHGRPAGAHGRIRTEYPHPSAGAGEAGKDLRVRPDTGGPGLGHGRDPGPGGAVPAAAPLRFPEHRPARALSRGEQGPGDSEPAEGLTASLGFCCCFGAAAAAARWWPPFWRCWSCAGPASCIWQGVRRTALSGRSGSCPRI